MNFKAIILTLSFFLTSSLFSACTTTTEQESMTNGQQEREDIETAPIIAPGIGIGGFSGPGFGSGGFFGGGIGVFEEEEEEG